jgi:hypothetical protein
MIGDSKSLLTNYVNFSKERRNIYTKSADKNRIELIKLCDELNIFYEVYKFSSFVLFIFLENIGRKRKCYKRLCEF